jgi:hypothetical protein
MAWGGDVQSAEKEQRAGAQKTFEAGSKLYDTKHYGEALAAFRASYQIVASPNSRLMIARCLRDLGKNAEAYREYDAVAAEAARGGERYKSSAEAATEERDELKAKLAFLTVHVADAPAGTSVKVGETAVAAADLGVALPFEPGQMVVTAANEGASARADVTLTAGAASDVELRLAKPESAPPPAVVVAPAPVPVAPPAPSTSPLRTWSYVAGGVGIAGFATFAIFGAMTSSKYSSLQSACPGGRCPAGKQGDVDSGKTDQTVANVGLGVGIVGLVAGGTLFFLSTRHHDDVGTVQIGVGPRSATLSGRF